MTKEDKVAKVMHEWKQGKLTSHGKVVTDYDQAIAIALSEAGLSKKMEEGGWVLYDEDDERLIKVYETESEARKNLYEYEGNANIVEKSSWDNNQYAEGGGIKKYYDVFYSTKGGGSMVAKNIEASSEEEAKEKLTKQMRASSSFDKPIAVIQKYADGGAITDKSWAKINETLWDKGEIMVIDESKFGGKKVFSVENNLTKDVKEFEDKKEAYKYAIEVSSMPSGTKMLYLYKLGYKKEAYEIRKSSKSEVSENSTFESFKRVMDKVVDSKNEVYSSKKFAEGGGIGFIPMDLEEKLMIIAKWGGISIKGVIGILNAMIDSGITDADLTPKPIKNTSFQRERATEKKIQDIWKEIEPKYNGTLKGNQYYSTVKRLIQYSNYDILKRYKPFRKYQYAEGGGVESEKVKEGDILISNYSDYYKLIKLGNGYFEVGKLDIHNKIKNFINIPEDFSEQSSFKKANKEELQDFYNDINTDEDYAKGGGIGEENALMVANNNKQIAHHTEEMESALKDVDYVPAWVVAKVNRSASDLSDATHYLEGSEYKNEKKENMNKYEGGGEILGKIYEREVDNLPIAIEYKQREIKRSYPEQATYIEYGSDSKGEYAVVRAKGKAKFAVGGGVEGVEWDKDEDGYRTKLGDFNIRISPSTQKGYWDIYVREKTKTISNKYDVYGIDNAKNIAYDIVGDYMKKFEGGGEIEAKIEKLKKNVLNSKFVSDSVKETARKQIEKFEKELEESKETKADEKSEHKAGGSESKSEEKVGVSKIKILWAEGDNSKYDKFPKEYSSWSLANKAIIPVYKDTLGNEGYNKLKFEVTFKDGETYDGRLDVSEREDNPTKSNNVIGQHIKEFLDYMSSDKSRESDSYKKEIKDWLEKYDLGLDTKETKSEADNYFNLKGKSIDIFYMGVETPETKTITSAKVTPEKYSVREVTLTTKNGTVSVFPMKKTNAFMNGEEIEIKGGKEVYIIKLNKSEEKPATKKPGTKGRPTKVVKAKEEVKGDLPKSKYEIGDKVGVSGDNEIYEIKDKSYRNNLDNELTWVYYLPEYSSVLVSEKNLKVVKAKKEVKSKVVGDDLKVIKFFDLTESDWNKMALNERNKLSESYKEKTKKPKVDRKKVVEKAKAKKKSIKDYSNKTSINQNTGERYKRSESSDKKREALPLGKRVSADGNIYYENRLNHADFDKKEKFEKGGEVKSSGFGLNFLKW